MKVVLKPLGDVADEVADELKEKVRLVFNCPVAIKPGLNQLADAYDSQRRQYLASKLIGSLIALGKGRDERVVGITEVDLYAPGLNFVFGEADIIHQVVIISLCRLRQEYYGLPPDKKLFIQRAIKEIVHEIGHTFDLEHCHDQKCVMHFSNCLADTDWKEASFCSKCRPKII
jgi:archaemetzincin